MSRANNLLHYTTLSHGAAEVIIEAGARAAQERGWAVSIAVVDRGGYLIAFRRMDGGVPAGVDGAIEKAVSCAKFREPLTRFSRMAREQDWIGNMPGLIPLGGAEPLYHEDDVIGVVSVSGANEPVEQAIAEVAAGEFNDR